MTEAEKLNNANIEFAKAQELRSLSMRCLEMAMQNLITYNDGRRTMGSVSGWIEDADALLQFVLNGQKIPAKQ